MEKLKPSDCLIRSVRVERINAHCLPPVGVVIAPRPWLTYLRRALRSARRKRYVLQNSRN